MKNSNQINVPQAREAMDKFKMQAAQEMGVNLKQGYNGDLTSREALPLVRDCFRFIRDYEGEVPGASPRDCGNYLDMNLNMAHFWAKRYAALLENIDESRLNYPED